MTVSCYGQKSQPNNAFKLKNAAFVHFGPILTCFRPFLILIWLKSSLRQHISRRYCKVQVDMSKRLNQSMILCSKRQILHILQIFDFFFCLWKDVTSKRLDRFWNQLNHFICLKNLCIFVTNFLCFYWKMHELPAFKWA